MKQSTNKTNYKTKNPIVKRVSNIRRIKNMVKEEIDKIFNEGNLIYWCQYINYGELLLSKNRVEIKNDNTFLIVKQNINERMQGTFICSFHAQGIGFFLEKKDFAESLQVYKATENRDYFFTVIEETENNKKSIKTKNAVLNKKELLSFLPEYFDGVKSLFKSDTDELRVDRIYEFIK